MVKRILVPVDFSEGSLEAVENAIEWAKIDSAVLLLMHVVEFPYYALPSSDVLADQKALARIELERLAEKLAARKVACEMLVRVGTPFIEIVNAARDRRADMIVIGTHGRTGFSHLLMGSVAEKVVRASTCPVLSVRGSKPSEKGQGNRPPLAPKDGLVAT